MYASLHVFVEMVDHDHDHWCNTCLLSTGVRLVYAVRTDHGASIREKLVCIECDGSDITLNPEPRHC